MKKLKIILFSLVILIILIVVFISFSVFRNKTAVSAREKSTSAYELYKQADSFVENGKLLEAKKVYKKIIRDFPDFKEITEVEEKLQDLNMKILFSPIRTDKTEIYEVKAGDSLAKIAKKFHTTIEFIKKSNGLSTDVIKVGKRLRIWTGKFSCIIDKSQNTLTLKSDDEIMKVYRVSTGADNHTPVGTYRIMSKLVNPVWYKEGRAIPPESPENILGSRWMGFNPPFSDYGIHGTTEPETIGRHVTQGCVRMYNEDVEELYLILPIGTEVIIID
jgi:flagellar basal body-associated protein FliL